MNAEPAAHVRLTYSILCAVSHTTSQQGRTTYQLDAGTLLHVLFHVRSYTCQHVAPPRSIDVSPTYSTVRHTMTTYSSLSVLWSHVIRHTSFKIASCSTENKHNNKREDELGWYTQPFAVVGSCILHSPFFGGRTKTDAGLTNFAELVGCCGCFSGYDFGREHSVASYFASLQLTYLITSPHQKSRTWLAVAFHKYGLSTGMQYPQGMTCGPGGGVPGNLRLCISPAGR